MKNFIQEGEVIIVTAPANVSSGDLVVVGSLVGVAADDALQNAAVEIQTEGVFSLPKKSTDEITAGEKLYWDSGNGYLTKTAGNGSKPLAGLARAAAGNGVATVECLLMLTGQTGPA